MRESTKSPEAPAPEAPLEPWETTRVVGTPRERIDGYERVSGSAVYTLDLSLPGMLHAAVVRSPHAHAVVTRVDTRAAAGMPGVHAVLSNDDPEARISVPYPWWIPEGPEMRLFDPHCRYAGEEVAAVAAESQNQAVDAARAVSVEYDLRPFVLDAEEALAPEAPAVHEGGNRVAPVSRYRRGDLAKGLAEADVVLRATYRTSCELHTPMEVHGSVARWEGNQLTVWDSTQGVFDQRDYLARALRLPLAAVRVIGHYMGGGFGSKAELGKHTLIAALLARKTARPVKLCLTREETFLCVGNRPPNTITLEAGATKDGRLVALRLSNVGAVGAYRDMADVGYPAMDQYLCPNVEVEETEVYVHAGKARAMRAPGFPQCAWALEQMLDALAERIGVDPVELRLRNLPRSSQVREGVHLTSNGFARCLTEGAQAFSWSRARTAPRGEDPLRRGVGVAAGFWPHGARPPAWAIVKLLADGSVSLSLGASDIGTGTKTVMAMVVAEELGVPVDAVRIDHADTATTQPAPVSGGSMTVVTNAPAVRAAAQEVKRQLLEIAAAELERPASTLVLREGRVASREEPGKEVALSELRGLAARRAFVGVGERKADPPGRMLCSFAVHFAEVEVNVLTGEVRVLRLLGAHDSGRVMNLLTYRNQVFGGMTMGIGFGMSERRVLDRQTGRVLNANWHDYKIPTALDVPADMTCLPIDPQDKECNAVGAKGLGEPATIPTAAAIANAVFHATGVRVTEMPLNPTRLATLLAEKRAKEG